jgi:hypothetical protein
MERRHDAVARGGVKPGHFWAEPFRTLIRRGGRGFCSGDVRSGSTVCLRRGEEQARGGAVFGLSRDTIAKMCRYSAPPGYVRSKQPERPKLGPLVPVVDATSPAPKVYVAMATLNLMSNCGRALEMVLTNFRV